MHSSLHLPRSFDARSRCALVLAIAGSSLVLLAGCGGDSGSGEPDDGVQATGGDSSSGGSESGGSPSAGGSAAGGSSSDGGGGGAGGNAAGGGNAATGGSASGGSGGAATGGTSGNEGTFEWTGTLLSEGYGANVAHDETSGTLECEQTGSGLILRLSGSSAVPECVPLSQEDMLTLRLPGYSGDSTYDHSPNEVGPYLVQASFTAGPKGVAQCGRILQGIWSSGCQISATTVGSARQIDVSCSNVVPTLTTSISFEPALCDGVDTGFSHCTGDVQECSVFSTSECGFHPGCSDTLSCRPYTGPECSVFDEANCAAHLGCAWNGGSSTCGANKSAVGCPLVLTDLECFQGGCLPDHVCQGAESCGSQDEVSCAGLPACSLSFAL